MKPSNPKSSDLARFYAIAEIAELLGVSSKSIRRWIAAGDLIAHHIGRQWRISEKDLQNFLKLRRTS